METETEPDPFTLGWIAGKEEKDENENPWNSVPTGDKDHWKYIEWNRGWLAFILLTI